MTKGSSASKVDIWMPIMISKYVNAVVGLSRADSGSYLHALMHHWKYGPLPSDITEVIRIMKIEEENASSIAQGLLRRFFVQLDDGTWMQPTNKRMKDEAAGKRLVYNERAKKAAAARWKNKRKIDASSIPQAVLGQVLEECPSPTEVIQIPPPTPSGLPPKSTSGGSVDPEKRDPQKRPRSDRNEGEAGIAMELERARARTARTLGAPPHPMLEKNGKNEADSREEPFRVELAQWWAEMNHVSIDKCPWGKPGERALRSVLQASSMSLDDLRTCLEHRWLSVQAGEYAPSIIPSRWLRELPSFLSGPLTKHRDPLPMRRR